MFSGFPQPNTVVIVGTLYMAYPIVRVVVLNYNIQDAPDAQERLQAMRGFVVPVA